MNSNINIKQQVQEAFRVNALLQGTEIGIAVQNGNVLLSGHVNKFCQKRVARKIAKDVEGVNSVNEELIVLLRDEDRINDAALKEIIGDKFTKNFGNAAKDINVVVKDGYVWLEGRLRWKYQRDLAMECIAEISGIKWIENNIVVPESIQPPVDEKNVLAAIYGDESITADIRIEVSGHRVILKGSIDSANQKNLVTRLVRSVPGVSEIENFLIVRNNAN